jgi:hypothetical protein
MNVPDENHLELLQGIESAVQRVYGREPALIDMDVLDAYGSLVRRYAAEESGRSAPNLRLAERPARVFSALLETCEQILGRAHRAEDGREAPPTLADLLRCLRCLEGSVRHWSRECGSRGYLEFINDYVV